MCGNLGLQLILVQATIECINFKLQEAYKPCNNNCCNSITTYVPQILNITRIFCS